MEVADWLADCLQDQLRLLEHGELHFGASKVETVSCRDRNLAHVGFCHTH